MHVENKLARVTVVWRDFAGVLMLVKTHLLFAT